MARCRRCGKSGLFFHVNQEGYCELCAVALRKESVDRNIQHDLLIFAGLGRSPQGERG